MEQDINSDMEDNEIIALVNKRADYEFRRYCAYSSDRMNHDVSYAKVSGSCLYSVCFS